MGHSHSSGNDSNGGPGRGGGEASSVFPVIKPISITEFEPTFRLREKTYVCGIAIGLSVAVLLFIF